LNFTPTLTIDCLNVFLDNQLSCLQCLVAMSPWDFMSMDVFALFRTRKLCGQYSDSVIIPHLFGSELRHSLVKVSWLPFWLHEKSFLSNLSSSVFSCGAFVTRSLDVKHLLNHAVYLSKSRDEQNQQVAAETFQQLQPQVLRARKLKAGKALKSLSKTVAANTPGAPSHLSKRFISLASIMHTFHPPVAMITCVLKPSYGAQYPYINVYEQNRFYESSHACAKLFFALALEKCCENDEIASPSVITTSVNETCANGMPHAHFVVSCEPCFDFAFA